MTIRYIYGTYRSQESAEAALEEGFAMGDIVPGEHPFIERRLDRYGERRTGGWAITLGDAAPARGARRQ